jgi:arsenate reductase (glutaredoxin)
VSGTVLTMAELTVYEKRTCTTCRNLATLLEERGIDFDRVDYHVEPLPREKIAELASKTGRPARELMRKKEPVFKELGLSDRELEDDEAIDLMAEHPQLLERPVVERGERAVLARPVERIDELL